VDLYQDAVIGCDTAVDQNCVHPGCHVVEFAVAPDCDIQVSEADRIETWGGTCLEFSGEVGAEIDDQGNPHDQFG